MTNISLVTKNRLFGQCLGRFLESEMAISTVKNYSNLEDLFDLKKSPGIVIFELMTDFCRFQSFSSLVELYPDVKILVFSDNVAIEVYKKLINNGVKGYVSLSSELSELLKAVHEVSSGKIYFPYELLKILMQENQPEAEKYVNGLTDREVEILKLLCDGLSNEQISVKLHLSYDTVKWHRSNLLIKTECKNILALYKYAIKHNFLQV